MSDHGDSGRHGAHQERQQVPGRQVGPVQVLDHQHGAALATQGREQVPNSVQEPAAVFGGRDRRRGRVDRERRKESRQLAPNVRRAAAQSAVQERPPRTRTERRQRVHDRPVRERLRQRQRGPSQHQHARDGGDDLGDQPALADAGVPGHQDHPAAGAVEGGAEHSGLGATADEGGCLRHALRAAHPGPPVKQAIAITRRRCAAKGQRDPPDGR